jgi:hypothetical protein
MADPLDVPRYRNAAHAAYTIVREEGFRTLYRGVTLTALRQSTNQAVNFTAYTYFKQWALKYQDVPELPSYQHTVLGLVSGAMGPLSNAPIDTISEHYPCHRRRRLEAFYLRMGTETRLQRSSAKPGESALTRIRYIASDMFKQEGFRAFYKGITPRVMRVAPGQVCESEAAVLRADPIWWGCSCTDVDRGLGRDVHRVRVHPWCHGEIGGSRGGQGIPRVSSKFVYVVVFAGRTSLLHIADILGLVLMIHVCGRTALMFGYSFFHFFWKGLCTFHRMRLGLEGKWNGSSSTRRFTC